MEEGNWIKAGIVFVICGILPVWVFPLMESSLKWKLLFTVGAALGSWSAFEFGAVGKKH